MARSKEPDLLSRISTLANNAGMSYGKYVALHPEALRGEEKPIKPAMPSGVKLIRVCPICGEEFPCFDTRARLYCGDKCRYRAANDKRRANYHIAVDNSPEQL